MLFILPQLPVADKLDGLAMLDVKVVDFRFVPPVGPAGCSQSVEQAW